MKGERKVSPLSRPNWLSVAQNFINLLSLPLSCPPKPLAQGPIRSAAGLLKPEHIRFLDLKFNCTNNL